ncbi:MAG TPA: hypothetical protein VHT53_03930 [Candidatus Elarobacter sp.]|nr:hypothetical protein [Candidatus Elarobacter sp.]
MAVGAGVAVGVAVGFGVGDAGVGPRPGGVGVAGGTQPVTVTVTRSPLPFLSIATIVVTPFAIPVTPNQAFLRPPCVGVTAFRWASIDSVTIAGPSIDADTSPSKFSTASKSALVPHASVRTFGNACTTCPHTPVCGGVGTDSGTRAEPDAESGPGMVMAPPHAVKAETMRAPYAIRRNVEVLPWRSARRYLPRKS